MKKGKLLKKEKGITLIALVITIVVMLILAGVTINLTLGENGIFTTAQRAAKNYTDSQNKEIEDLNNFTNLINNTIGELGNVNNGTGKPVIPEQPELLPENTSTTPSGTLVQKPAGKTWDETKINSYADGIGNTIPVPVGFAPITTEEQGTKLSGFVIKDVSVDSEGNPTDTNGNEFVWVPVEGMSYTYDRYAMLESQLEWELDSVSESMKIKYSTSDDNYFTEKMPDDEETSVATYGGYYIGRYESGIVCGEKGDTKTEGTYYTGDNIKLVVKAGQQVWNYIEKGRALSEATSLYNKNTNNVSSKLCSSYAWDTALKFMESTGSTYPTNSVGGYYGQTSPATTGYDTAHPCNIYDMGGNAWEWTTETFSDTDNPGVFRGGSYDNSASYNPAALRTKFSTTGTSGGISFRVTLFM